jgi:hypothetical protein
MMSRENYLVPSLILEELEIEKGIASSQTIDNYDPEDASNAWD